MRIVRRKTRWITLLFVVVVCAGTEMPAVTQQYPTKPVLIIEPFGTGGGPDLLARTLAQQLSKLWGQPVTVENVPGAGATAGPCTSREVATRRVYVAHHYQCSSIQRCLLKESAV